MKKIINKKTFIIVVPLLIVYVGGCNAFHMILIPNASLYGRDCPRELAVEKIDRGNDVFPEEITDITFYVSGRAYPRGVLYFTGNVNFSSLKQWADKKEIPLKKRTYGSYTIRGITEHLGLEMKSIKNPYIGKRYEDMGGGKIIYDDHSKKCYVSVELPTIGPYPRSLSEDSFKQWKLFLFPFFTTYWLDKTVKSHYNE